MKKISLILISAVVALLTACSDKPSGNFETAKNDPLDARIYTLDNGLKVYMTVYKDAPRIQTYIAVKAGSKNDPSDATGLAHYLEHMLFKGTDQYGTLDYAKEEVELKKIEELYEVYRKTTDKNERKKLYHQIDSISGVAAKFAIANEYDKMMAAIGAKGTNAYTWVEQTVYVNDVPSNQLHKWLKIEAERYRKPVLRIFHTELEAVYEEKNISLDEDQSKVWDNLFAGLFPTHTYGTQTTIGTIEHLKNPSIKKIKEYYNSWYVPNNMAICLSGDFDPDSAIAWVQKEFGSMVKKEVPSFTPPVEKAITAPVIKEVVGPESEEVDMAFRFAGYNSKEAEIAELVDGLLFNGTAGLIDLDLVQQQKILEGSSAFIGMKDYSAHIISGKNKEGQKLEEVKDLILTEIEKLKKGDFPDWLITAVVNDLKRRKSKEYESNNGRANAFVNAFVLDVPWQDYVDRMDHISSITKKDIIDFVKTHYTNNYVVVYKRTGEDKNVEKVEKPAITPVEVNRDSQSAFVKNVVEEKVADVEPVFVDFSKEITKTELNGGALLFSKENTDNNLFDLAYFIPKGKNEDRKLNLAVEYLPFLGTDKMSAAQIQQEFYKLGCTMSVNTSEEETVLAIEGLDENREKAIALFEDLITHAKADPIAYQNVVENILKSRANDKLSPEVILWRGLLNYGTYGSKNPFTNILTEAELKAINPEELTAIIHTIFHIEHEAFYYGPSSSDAVKADLEKNHKVLAPLEKVAKSDAFVEQVTDKPMVLFVNYPGMKQAEIMMINKGELYNKSIVPNQVLFNEYFGGGMQSVVFQDLRESKALAYSARSTYNSPSKKERSHYNIAYIGTQSDKLPEAMKGMNDLLTTIPESGKLFDASKEAILNKYRTERITKSGVLSYFRRMRKLGLDYDIRKDNFEFVGKSGLQDVKNFHKTYVSGKPKIILVLGDKNVLDKKALAAYGEIKELSLKEIFGY
ncbi:MAG: insulinase family protein [Bacteroidia bacterium]|nr:insulinase family protein [Bacteroidia bacterium]